MREPIIVADSSPLIGLARIGQLNLLPQLGSRIIVPPAVWQEVTIARATAPGASEVASTTWIEIESPDPLLVQPLTILLDQGEAEAIALAGGYTGSIVLLDDARARRVAERMSVRRIGTLGLLRRAKQAGLIQLVRPHITALLNNGIYIRQEIIDAVLKEVGE